MVAIDGHSKSKPLLEGLQIAVVIPCYNEAQAIEKVVRDFRIVLPEADIYVYDNNSTDGTSAIAQKAGAFVRNEPRQGKGFVVRRMFADIDADVYVMTDGDNTYDALRAREMVQRLVADGLDMVNGIRVETDDSSPYRPGHKFGNAMLTWFVRMVFGRGVRDMMSGYRVFSRRFVKSFPATSTGFEVETELTAHALDLVMPFAEIETDFSEREIGSESKLRTFTDGFRILWTIIKLMKRERPVTLFGILAVLTFIPSISSYIPILFRYFETGVVPRYPTLIIATGLGVIAILCVVCAMILDTVTYGRKEQKRLHYLAIPGVLATQGLIRKARARAARKLPKTG